jgi:hypothetical protein
MQGNTDDDATDAQEYDLDAENIHAKPITVTEAGGSTYAVRVTETYKDGSEHTEHYTPEQARKLRDELNDILNE